MSFAELTAQPKWWKEGVCYQVWPQSFKDSNGDGLGDIPGLIGKLDYLKDLGVDYVWLSPMYASPRHDYGYDISDYEDVDPTFGTLKDMDDLIAGLHSRNMRLMLDLVVNHTSTEHKWFKESAKSKDNEYSNYYMWRDPKIVDGKKCPPNNWKSLFGGPGWEYVEARDQYFLHLFLETMPDLNWEDETVRRAIYKSAIDFWLKRGVDGFRVDTVNLYSKNLSFPDAPIVDPKDEFQPPPTEDFINGPGMHKWLREQRTEVLDKYDKEIALVGELGFCSTEDLKRYIGPAEKELDMVFDFAIYMASGPDFQKPMIEWVDKSSLKALREALMKSQGFLSEHGLWTTTFFENHDQSRSVKKFGSRDPQYQWQSAKLLAVLLIAMSGTLFIYQGQEIGMTGVPPEWPRSDLRDPFWVRFLEEADQKYADDEAMRLQAEDIAQRCGRDHARTPVQWSKEEPYAGFSQAEPWIRVNEEFRKGVNVEDQQADADSLLSFWKKAVRFRKEHSETLIYGFTEFVDNDNEKVFSVVKTAQDEKNKGKKLLVVMNYSDAPQPMPTADQIGHKGDVGRVLFATSSDTGSSELQPWEARVLELP